MICTFEVRDYLIRLKRKLEDAVGCVNSQKYNALNAGQLFPDKCRYT